MKKNILILSPDSIVKSMGGLGVHLYNLLLTIDTSRYEVVAITPNEDDCIVKEGVRVYSIHNNRHLSKNVDIFGDIFITQSKYCCLCSHLISTNKMSKPDIIHFLDWSTSVAAVQLSVLFQTKLVFAVHLSIANSYKNINDLQRLGYDLACELEFTACEVANKIIHVTKTYSEIFEFLPFTRKTEIVHNGVSVEQFVQKSEYKFPGTNRIKILYLGRIEPSKGIIELLETKLPEGVDLIFAGGKQGSSESLLDYLVETCSKSANKHYIGYLSGQDKVDAISTSDMVIMPSKHEPFGLVALEALASSQNGKTILSASFEDGLGEFLTDRCAINCGITPSSIQKSIEYFVTMKEDEKEAMRLAATEVAKKYTWQKMTKKIETIWSNL